MSKVKWKVKYLEATKWYVVYKQEGDWEINCYESEALARRVCRLLNRDEKEKKA